MAVTSLATSLAAVTTTRSASAGIDLGVDYVSVMSGEDFCLDDAEVGCAHDAAPGPSNTIYVTQSEVAGEFVYDTVAGSLPNPDDVWIATHWEAGCEVNYHLIAGLITAGSYDTSGWWNRYLFEVGTPSTDFFVTDERTYSRPVDMKHPIADVLSYAGIGPDPIGAVLDHGENLVAARMAEGMPEFQARAEPGLLELTTTWHGVAACKGNWFGSEYYETSPVELPIDVVYVPLDSPIGGDDAVEGGGLQAVGEVTQAVATVQPDPDGYCQVHLGGTFVANQPMSVDYRVVDGFGHRSRTFTTEIDGTLVAHVAHEVEITPPVEPDAGGTLVSPTGGGDPDMLATEDNGNITGVVHIEVVSPNAMESNPSGYSVPSCEPEPNEGVPAIETATNERTVEGRREVSNSIGLGGQTLAE